jgi:hypothetical protein
MAEAERVHMYKGKPQKLGEPVTIEIEIPNKNNMKKQREQSDATDKKIAEHWEDLKNKNPDSEEIQRAYAEYLKRRKNKKNNYTVASKKSKLAKGGMYKGKKHNYVAGGMVKDMNIMRKN